MIQCEKPAISEKVFADVFLCSFRAPQVAFLSAEYRHVLLIFAQFAVNIAVSCRFLIINKGAECGIRCKLFIAVHYCPARAQFPLSWSLWTVSYRYKSSA